MKKFSQFRQTLTPKPATVVPVVETTVPEHLNHIPEDLAENYHHTHVSDATREKMHIALGGKGFTTFPLNDEDHAANDDVIEHLAGHGYSVKDYRKGIAQKMVTVGDPERGIPHRQKLVDEKIGSVLDKTQAPDHVKKAYMNDGARTGLKAAKNNTLHVLVSTTPHAVAGMSTGTPWKSCTNLVDGSNKSFLKSDMEHGTHVAYLVQHDDPTAFKTGAPTRPLARIALKPFHHEDNSDDTVYRTDSADYGHGGDKFRTSVDEWAHKHYPAQTGATYNRNSHVLENNGDADRFVHLSHTAAIENLENGDGVDGEHGKTYMTHDTTSKVLNHFVKKVKEHGEGTHAIKSLIQSVNFSPAHVKTVLSLADSTNNSGLVGALASRHGSKFPASVIEKHYGDSSHLPTSILSSPNLPDHMVDNLNRYQLSNVAPSKIKQKHIDKLVDSFVRPSGTYGIDAHTLGTFSHKFSSDNISDIVNHGSYVPGVDTHEKFTKEHHDNWIKKLKHTNAPQANLVISNSKHASLDDVKDGDGVDPVAYKRLLFNENTSKETHVAIKNHILDAVKSQSTELGSDGNKYESRFNLYKGDGYSSHRDQSVIPAHISKHLTTQDYDTIAKAGKVPNFDSPLHSAKLLTSYRNIAGIHDEKLYSHIDSQREAKGLDHGDFYNEDDDETAKSLRKTLHRHMARYGAALEDHYNEHVKDTANGTGEIKNLQQHDNVGDHLEQLQHMNAYYSPHNSHYHSHDHDANEHYYENFADVEDSHTDGEKQKDYNSSLRW